MKVPRRYQLLAEYICPTVVILMLACGIGCDGNSNKNTDNNPPSDARKRPNDAVASGSDAADKSGLKKTPNDRATPPTTIDRSVTEPDVNDSRFHTAIKKVADEYLQYGLINPDSLQLPSPRVAPTLCRAPFPEPPAVRQSDSDPSSAHGKKLYFLFAKDIAHYSNRDGSASPAGQALVKEAWTARPSNANARNLRTHASAVRVNPRAQVDGQTFEIGQRTDLFVMIKQPPSTEGTDEGWAYGVIDADSREVKSAGAVASCVACHAPQTDRLFRSGIPNFNDSPTDEISADASQTNVPNSLPAQ